MKFPDRRRFVRLAAGMAVLPILPRIARAQAYPTKPIRLVVPFPPGGAFDFVGRPWADKMKPLVGTVVIENIGGVALRLVPPLSLAPALMATRFCLAALRRTLTRPCSRAGLFTTR